MSPYSLRSIRLTGNNYLFYRRLLEKGRPSPTGESRKSSVFVVTSDDDSDSSNLTQECDSPFKFDPKDKMEFEANEAERKKLLKASKRVPMALKRQIQIPQAALDGEDGITLSPIKGTKPIGRKARGSAISIAKYQKFSQQCHDSSDSDIPEDSRRGRKKKAKIDPKQKTITSFFQSTSDIDERPSSPPPCRSSSPPPTKVEDDNPEDENLDQICKRKLRELEELNQFHINKANELRKFEEDNLKLKDRLEEEVSETVIEELFQQNFQLIEVNIAP